MEQEHLAKCYSFVHNLTNFKTQLKLDNFSSGMRDIYHLHKVFKILFYDSILITCWHTFHGFCGNWPNKLKAVWEAQLSSFMFALSLRLTLAQFIDRSTLYPGPWEWGRLNEFDWATFSESNACDFCPNVTWIFRLCTNAAKNFYFQTSAKDFWRSSNNFGTLLMISEDILTIFEHYW